MIKVTKEGNTCFKFVTDFTPMTAFFLRQTDSVINFFVVVVSEPIFDKLTSDEQQKVIDISLRLHNDRKKKK